MPRGDDFTIVVPHRSPFSPPTLLTHVDHGKYGQGIIFSKEQNVTASRFIRIHLAQWCHYGTEILLSVTHECVEFLQNAVRQILLALGKLFAEHSGHEPSSHTALGKNSP